MLQARQPILRRFWYPVIPLDQLNGGPRAFTLLNTPLVLWLTGDGKPVAMRDRCCHRSARLSGGWIEDGHIVCPYHGWTYGADGVLVRIPQIAESGRNETIRVPSYRAAARYGYVWVALDDPLTDIPDLPEAEAAGYRLIQEFYEPWRCSALRLMENSFDGAHLSYVHKSSFGDIKNPKPADFTVEEFDGGFHLRSESQVRNPELGKKTTGSAEDVTTRRRHQTWFMPFCRKFKITYPNGLEQIIFTAATPIDDESIQVCQFVVRNDTEAEVRAADVIAYDRQITGEDRVVLEGTDGDAPLDIARGGEFHMPSDKPGLLMRQHLSRLLAAHGESEVRRRTEAA
ncbi:MAG: aromatic ring-hydroxylating dioxygenase subunit alpha [Alphaproteobacteria bacterium]